MISRATPRQFRVHRLSRGMTFGEWLLVLFSVGFLLILLISFFVPAKRIVHPSAMQVHCRNQLKQIGLALNAYAQSYGRYPPTSTVDAEGRPLHSWRTLLLPYLEENYKQTYYRLDLSKPWDDPVNAELLQKLQVPAFKCPALFPKDQETTYLALRMAGNTFHLPTNRTFTERAAGPPESLIVVEVDVAHAVPWMSPQDADPAVFLGINKHSQISHPRGTHGLFANGIVQHFPANMTGDERRNALEQGLKDAKSALGSQSLRNDRP